MWAYLVNEEILATNQNDMSGNSGWVKIDGKVPDQITCADGNALYKFVKNKIVARSEKEISEDAKAAEKANAESDTESAFKSAKTSDEKLAALARAVWGGN